MQYFDSTEKHWLLCMQNHHYVNIGLIEEI